MCCLMESWREKGILHCKAGHLASLHIWKTTVLWKPRRLLLHPCPRSIECHICWDHLHELEQMLAYVPLDEKSLALLLNYLHDFLKYLARTLQLCLVPALMKCLLQSTIRKLCESLFTHLCLDLCKLVFVF